MHICFLCSEYPGLRQTYGGVGTFTRTLARALVARGHQVTVVGAYERSGTSEDCGVRLVQVRVPRMHGVGALLSMLAMRRALSELYAHAPFDVLDGPELSLAGVPKSVSAVCVIRMNGGHHFFYTAEGRKPRFGRALVERMSFARADALAAVSRYVAEVTRHLLRLGPRPIEILPNPVNTALFHPRDGVSPVPGRVMFVGTLCEKKGIRQLVQAMPLVARRVPNAHLVAIGRDWRDPKTGQSYLERLTQEEDASALDLVSFRGPVPNDTLPGELATASVCVYPSHMEALPVAWVEGMACGKAVVASQTGPGPEVIENGVSGLLCNPHDPNDIAEKVVQVLCDRDLAERLGKAARERAEAVFSVDVLVRKNEAFYERCVEQKQRK